MYIAPKFWQIVIKSKVWNLYPTLCTATAYRHAVSFCSLWEGTNAYLVKIGSRGLVTSGKFEIADYQTTQCS